MPALRLVTADQLSHSLSALEGIEDGDVILICEVMQEATYVKHHPKKIAFLFAAMRHFAQELQANGHTVRYVKLNDTNNTGSFDGELERAINDLSPDRLIVTEPGEYRILEKMRSWKKARDIPIEIRTDTRFLATHDQFAAWAKDKKQLRMEFFYREMRKSYNILLDQDGKPSGGEWNYDKENRKPPKDEMHFPQRISHTKSDILKDVLSLVSEEFKDHYGTLEPFHYAVTRDQAMQELDHFISDVLPHFGDHQDAMLAGEPYLYHSLLSSYLNAGLLEPLEICHKAEDAYRSGNAPLNAVEGFIRQILGWREYIRGIYWLLMPDYGERNTLNATTPLPEFYWSAHTNMFCMAESIRHTLEHAYSHHIQRLMVTGNFALLAGLDVKQVQEWYLAVYSDAYEWVEMPNTLGMALFGDDGVVASKPYAASGKYIHKMSNYCGECKYNPNEMTGDTACPFNALYWDFLARHEERFKSNHRMRMIYSTWHKFDDEKKSGIRDQAKEHLARMKDGTL